MIQGSELRSPKVSCGFSVAFSRVTGVIAALLFTLLFLVAFLFPETNSLAETAFASVRDRAGEGADLAFGSTEVTGRAEGLRVMQDTTKRSGTGGMSRRARALERRRSAVDTTENTKSVTKILEILKTMPRDSTARLAFGYVRRDQGVVSVFERRGSSLYLPDPSVIRIVQNLDSARFEYHVKRLLGNASLRIPLDYSFEDYRKLRLEEAVRKNWEDLAHAYQLDARQEKGVGRALRLRDQYQDSSPQKPDFQHLRPECDSAPNQRGCRYSCGIHPYQVRSFPQSSSRPAVTTQPDFSQEVQVNVKGQIGDKLNIDADWNTQRQFEYQNQLKVKYTGYADDIIQSVEAGNVSLTTNSSFISSSSALFGIKAAFQFGPLKLTTVASQKKGQIKQLSVSGGGKPTPFQIMATNYSTDYYFVDTSYIAWFDSAYLYMPPKVNNAKEIRDMEVWVTRIGNEDPNERDVVAFMDESKVLAAQGDPVARTQDYAMVPGEVEVGRFVRLDPTTDYTYHPYAGYITMNRSLQPQQAIAVAFTVPDPNNSRNNTNIGIFGSRDTSKSMKLVMKLVRPENLGPQYKTAWRMMLKNIYPLGGRGIKKDGFDLKILYQVPGQVPIDNILGVYNLLEVFGLD